jgi:hypothetical protein
MSRNSRQHRVVRARTRGGNSGLGDCRFRRDADWLWLVLGRQGVAVAPWRRPAGSILARLVRLVRERQSLAGRPLNFDSVGLFRRPRQRGCLLAITVQVTVFGGVFRDRRDRIVRRCPFFSSGVFLGELAGRHRFLFRASGRGQVVVRGGRIVLGGDLTQDLGKFCRLGVNIAVFRARTCAGTSVGQRRGAVIADVKARRRPLRAHFGGPFLSLA